MSTHDIPGITRRRFIKSAAAAGLGAASASGLAASASGIPAPSARGGEPVAAASGLADAVLEAFSTHRLVGLGELHGVQTHGDALALLLSDPRLPGVVDDIVVEFGNAFYQHTIDRFISGQPVADADLRLVWRNTVVSPLETWDEPMYEQVYRTIRAANRALPAGKRMRVLLGDAPIDWSKITDFCQWLPIFQTRDQHFVSVVKKHVVAKGRRALLLKGLDAFVRPMAIEQVTGERVNRPATRDPCSRHQSWCGCRSQGWVSPWASSKAIAWGGDGPPAAALSPLMVMSSTASKVACALASRLGACDMEPTTTVSTACHATCAMARSTPPDSSRAKNPASTRGPVAVAPARVSTSSVSPGWRRSCERSLTAQLRTQSGHGCSPAGSRTLATNRSVIASSRSSRFSMWL